jgi:hypothetical protein
LAITPAKDSGLVGMGSLSGCGAFGKGGSRTAPTSQSKLLANQFAQAISDLTMTRHRGAQIGSSVGINLMLLAGSVQIAARCYKLPNELSALHTSKVIGFART